MTNVVSDTHFAFDLHSYTARIGQPRLQTLSPLKREAKERKPGIEVGNSGANLGDPHWIRF